MKCKPCSKQDYPPQYCDDCSTVFDPSPEELQIECFREGVRKLHIEESTRSFFIDDLAKRLYIDLNGSDKAYEIAAKLWAARQRFIDKDEPRRVMAINALCDKYNQHHKKVHQL